MTATSLQSSTRMKKRSNRDMMGAVRLMFCWEEQKHNLIPLTLVLNDLCHTVLP